MIRPADTSGAWAVNPEREAKFRTRVESSGDWFWETDAEGRFTYSSPKIRDLLGLEPGDVIGKSRRDLMPPTEGRIFEATFGEIWNRHQPISLLESVAVRRDGAEVILQTNAVPVFEAGVFKGYRGIDRDITRLKVAQREITALAHTDILTGLFNRATFLDRLYQEFARARRTGVPFAFLYLDLDHFKDVNDTLGHPAGDALLRAVAGRLCAAVRETDTVGRIGGDEFAILQSNLVEPSDAGALAAKIQHVLSEPFAVAGNELLVTASVGVSVYRGDLSSADAMLAQADVALYRAKDEGRGRFAFHSHELYEEVVKRVALAEDLQAALKHGGLELYYQPQVALSDGRVVGVEALIRWHHPGRGLLLPGEFIPIAERRGLMPALGRWVISAACEQLAAWRKAEFAVPAMAINLSPAQFKATGILENDLRDALAEWQIPPGTVELEIPEAALTEVATEGGLEIERVRLLGVRFVVDDFGTGYSSLDKLVAYKIARLKIAPGFVGGANVNARDAAIVRAAVGLARELGIGVIAEGIETKDQAAFLLEAGCTCGQGFYFSRPVPAAVIAESLRRGRLAPGAPSTPAEGHTSDGDSPKLAGFM